MNMVGQLNQSPSFTWKSILQNGLCLCSTCPIQGGPPPLKILKKRPSGTNRSHISRTKKSPTLLKVDVLLSFSGVPKKKTDKTPAKNHRSRGCRMFFMAHMYFFQTIADLLKNYTFLYVVNNREHIEQRLRLQQNTNLNMVQI